MAIATKRSEAKIARILNTNAVTGAFDNPTPDVEWACADLDPDVFFPDTPEDLVVAQAICGTCPVRDVCRALAEARSESGVWGGVLLAEGVAQDGVKRRGRPRKVA